MTAMTLERLDRFLARHDGVPGDDLSGTVSGEAYNIAHCLERIRQEVGPQLDDELRDVLSEWLSFIAASADELRDAAQRYEDAVTLRGGWVLE
jgi:hypothetical protein